MSIPWTDTFSPFLFFAFWFDVKPSKSGKNVIPLPAVSREQAHWQATTS